MYRTEIEKPHVRPIVRGKVEVRVEFDAKIASSLVVGYVGVELQETWHSPKLPFYGHEPGAVTTGILFL